MSRLFENPSSLTAYSSVAAVLRGVIDELRARSAAEGNREDVKAVEAVLHNLGELLRCDFDDDEVSRRAAREEALYAVFAINEWLGRAPQLPTTAAADVRQPLSELARSLAPAVAGPLS